MDDQKIQALKQAIKNLANDLEKLDPTNVLHDPYFTIWTIRLLKYKKLLEKWESKGV